MKVAVMDLKLLILDDGGELVDCVEAKDITSRTLDRLIGLCETEIQERDKEAWRDKQ